MKARTGSLIRRASGYYIRVMIEGRIIVRALRNPDNTPCRTLTEARRAQAVFARPFALASKAEATQAILTQLADIQAEANPKPTIGGCWQLYLANPDRPQSGPSTLHVYEGYAKVFTDWAEANCPHAVYLESFTREQAATFLDYLSDRMSPNTVNKYHAFLRLLFRVLTDGKNPCFQKLRYRQAEATPHQPLTPQEMERVLSKATGELKTLVLIGCYCALRLGDACLLKWTDVDLDRGIISVVPRKTASRSRKRVTIPIHPALRQRLATTFRKGEHVMPWVAWRYSNDPTVISKRLRRVFRSAGIDTQEDGHTVRSYHSLRFSMGQQLISNGYTLEQIAQVLGHTTTAMSRHYSTITDTVKEQAILSLPSIHTA